jgi:ubiquinone/menaquinone biosynthesis C-methylase UbiE
MSAMDTEDFYDKIAPFYDLIFPDWEKSIERQAENLSSIIKTFQSKPTKTVLDVSCGIGTQALGLAKSGFQVTASDLSSAEVARAGVEAGDRGLDIKFSVCDMRNVFDHHKAEFDVVLSADNSVPHLLTDHDILAAFTQFKRCTTPGGLCLVTVRDYENENLESNVIMPYSVQNRTDGRYLIFQVWEVSGELYETSMYCVKDLHNGDCSTIVSRAKYYAVHTSRLIELMKEAGFTEVKRLDGVFYQPVIIGKRPV